MSKVLWEWIPTLDPTAGIHSHKTLDIAHWKGAKAVSLTFALLGFQHVGVGKMSCSIHLIKCCLNNMHVECVRYCLL